MKNRLIVLSIMGLISINTIVYATDKIPAQDIENSNIALEEARVFTRKGDYENSEIKLNKAIKLNNKNAEAYYEFGLIENWRNELNEAIKYTTKAIQINPNVDYYYVQRALINNKLLNTKEVIEDVNKAIELNPQNSYAYAIRGALKSYWNYSEEALEDLNNAIKYANKVNDTFIYSTRAMVYRQLHNYDAAIADYKTALAIVKAKNKKDEILFYTKGIEELEAAKNAFK